MIEYSGARIQLLDLPGIVEGASQGMIAVCLYSFLRMTYVNRFQVEEGVVK